MSPLTSDTGGNETLEELELFGLFRSLEALLKKEDALLMPLAKEIEALLNAGNFAAALPALDELEGYMDLVL